MTMLSRSRITSGAAIALALLVAAPLAFAQNSARRAHQPDQVNPIWRSWQFTQRGDLVAYSVEGAEGYDEERRAFAGERDGKKVVQITRYKDGERVDASMTEVTVENKPEGKRFADFYRRSGYQVTFAVRENGNVPFPCLKMDNPSEGLYIYAEDVPLGGLVEARAYRGDAVKLTLRGFRRAQEPAPSTIEVEQNFEGEGIVVSSITDSADQKKRADAAPTVTEGETFMREDLDTVPAYFRTKGHKSPNLRENFYVLICHHMSFNRSATYNVAHIDKTDPTNDYSYQREVQVVNHQGTIYYIERLSSAEGATPEGLTFGKRTVHVLVEESHPLNSLDAFDEGTKTGDLAGERGIVTRTMVVFDGPRGERTATEDGGEIQEVLRTRHDIVLTTRASPRLARWQQYDRWYYQEADATGKLLETEFEEAFTITSLRYERDLSKEEFEANQALVAAFAKGS